MSGNSAKPNTEEKLYPDTPWWASLVAVFVTAVVSIMGTVYVLRGGPSMGDGSAGPSGVAGLVADTITYIPHILLLFGILADMFTYEGVYSIPSLVGILSIFGNWLLRYFWKGVADILGKTVEIVAASPAQTAGGMGDFFKEYDGCSVQGFESWASPYAPQTLVITATVFMYYIIDNVLNRGWINALAGILMFAAFFVGQAFVVGPCQVPGETSQFSRVQQALMALSEGMLMGGIGYSVVAVYKPSRLPSSVISPFSRVDRSDLTLDANGNLVDSQGRKYITLPNGQFALDTCDADTRKSAAAEAGRNSGSGSPGKKSSCKSGSS